MNDDGVLIAVVFVLCVVAMSALGAFKACLTWDVERERIRAGAVECVDGGQP